VTVRPLRISNRHIQQAVALAEPAAEPAAIAPAPLAEGTLAINPSDLYDDLD
jgi:hypothetical protein